MEDTPSSGRLYFSSQNPGDSSDDSRKSASANLVIPSVGCHDKQKVDSGRIVVPAGEDDGTSDSERTVSSFGGFPNDGHGDVMEADSGLCKARDQDSRSEDAQKDENYTRHLKTGKVKSVDPGHHQQEIILQTKTGLLKILPKKIKVGRGNYESSIPLKNTENDGETGDGEIPLTDTTAVVPLPQAQDRREELPVPQWLKDCKSDVTNLDGWCHWQVHRTFDDRKDKFYRHGDYDYTFRSKKEVKRFLDTGEVKDKGLLEKKSSDPSGKSSGPRRSKKRRMEMPANDPIRKPQGYALSTSGEVNPSSSKLPHGFV